VEEELVATRLVLVSCAKAEEAIATKTASAIANRDSERCFFINFIMRALETFPR
jgi:hypothetical protein